MIKIGIVEDDRLLNESLTLLLEKEGYEVKRGYCVADGQNLLKEDLDLMILDLNLPDGVGFYVLQKQRKTPIIFLTARDEERDMIRAFENGCEDYIVKPFSMEVLKHRIKVVLRRTKKDEDILAFKELKIDYAKKKVYLKDEEIALTAKEYRLLEYLSRNIGQVLSKAMILENVWDIDGDFVGENTVSVTVNRLKKKLGTLSRKDEYIQNVFGMGYVFGDS